MDDCEKIQDITDFIRSKDNDRVVAASTPERVIDEVERLILVEDSVKLVMQEIREWSLNAGCTKTSRGRTLIAINRRLKDALKGKQALRTERNQNVNP